MVRRITKRPDVVINGDVIGVQWDAQATYAVQITAEALLENARALNRLVTVFTTSNVKINSLVHLGSDGDLTVSGKIVNNT
jgi:hypothetical protein